MRIEVDDLSSADVVDLLSEHLKDMESTSPPESRHALDLNELKDPSITFWCVRYDDLLAGCGALKFLTKTHAEIKSMRTSSKYTREGVGSKLLEFMISYAEGKGYKRLSLETGSMEYFKPARGLYSKYGFRECPPFSSYKKDPNSVFMTLSIESKEKA